MESDADYYVEQNAEGGWDVKDENGEIIETVGSREEAEEIRMELIAKANAAKMRTQFPR